MGIFNGRKPIIHAGLRVAGRLFTASLFQKNAPPFFNKLKALFLSFLGIMKGRAEVRFSGKSWEEKGRGGLSLECSSMVG